MTIYKKIRILPLLVIVATMALIIRVGDVSVGLRSLNGDVRADEQQENSGLQDQKSATMASLETQAGDNQAGADDKGAQSPDAGMQGQSPGKTSDAADPDWPDPNESSMDYSRVRMELFKDLSKRRQDLMKKEKALRKREALLRAAEQELDRKYQELESLRGEINQLLNDQSEQEQARINRLVKIYEGMKAKDAARIFNTLDMQVLLDVMGRMSERKTSPILAEMNPERARSVTILLAEEKKLPEGQSRN